METNTIALLLYGIALLSFAITLISLKQNINKLSKNLYTKLPLITSETPNVSDNLKRTIYFEDLCQTTHSSFVMEKKNNYYQKLDMYQIFKNNSEVIIMIPPSTHPAQASLDIMRDLFAPIFKAGYSVSDILSKCRIHADIKDMDNFIYNLHQIALEITKKN